MTVSDTRVIVSVYEEESQFKVLLDFRGSILDLEDLEDLENLEDFTLEIQERIDEIESVAVDREQDFDFPEGSKSVAGRLIPGLLKILILAWVPNVEPPIELLIPIIEAVQAVLPKRDETDDAENEQAEIKIQIRDKDGNIFTVIVNNQDDLSASIRAVKELIRPDY